MNDTFLGQSYKPTTDLFKEQGSLRLWDWLMFFEIFLKVIITNFLHDVIVVAALHNVHYFYDVVRF